VKRCPTCNKTFTDRNLSFCIDDGTPLSPVDEGPNADQDETTVVTPSPTAQAGRSDQREQAGYQPPGGYLPPNTPPIGQQGNRKAWPWVVGILALLLLAIAGLGIAAATFIPSMLRASNRNASNPPANVNPGTTDENLNANSNVEDVADVSAEESEPPTSESEVLSALTDLEHEWTVANINADKKKLNRILADDYVGTTVDGKTQGKVDYLRTIERDTSIQKWEFEDLKVSLLGDRATLSGVLRLETQNAQGQTAPFAFRFTDKFVWRANRWQAVSSEVTQEE
jgi:ketosteroid isomerase-like protein